MEARELRIGNLVYIPQTKKIEEIGCIEQNGRFTLKDWKESYSSILCLEPIPITEEWLLRFGFEKHNKEFWFKDFFIDIIYNSFNLKEGIGVYVADVYYIHQLQNLYFALTGEELTPRS